VRVDVNRVAGVPVATATAMPASHSGIVQGQPVESNVVNATYVQGSVVSP